MKKTAFGVIFVLLTVLSISAFRKDKITLWLVPRENSTIRVGMDIANRFPTLLVSYKVSTSGSLSLNGWTGTNWVNISLENFHSGNFFKIGPDSALIIEEEGQLVPNAMIPTGDWCDAVHKIATTRLRPLLHLVGRYYDFEYEDWEWISKNYKLSIKDINPNGLNVAWYRQRLKDFLNRNSGHSEDQQYWTVIRKPMDQAAILTVTNEFKSSTHPERKIYENPADNPLTNAVPASIIFDIDHPSRSKNHPTSKSSTSGK